LPAEGEFPNKLTDKSISAGKNLFLNIKILFD
jgi:hypothetical protein